MNNKAIESKKRRKYFNIIIYAFLICISLSINSACSRLPIINTTKPHYEQSEPTSDGKRIYVDSVGRKSEIPEVKRVIPSGRVAQLMIAMVAPEKLVGVSEVRRIYQENIPDNLPLTGQLYGGSGTVNYETMVQIKPDVILDLGEVKNTIREDMDDLKDVTKIPTIFLEADLKNTPQAFRALGELLGEPERGEKLAQFTEEALEFAEEGRSKIKDKKSVYQTSTDNALGADLDGTAHSEILNLIGAKNAAKVDASGGKPGQSVSMEQVLEWNPDVIISLSKKGSQLIRTDSSWDSIKAVQNDQIYTSPYVPFSWISQPPSANRIIGIYWMASKVYPEVYDVDLKEKTKEWYRLAFHHELTDEEYDELVNLD